MDDDHLPHPEQVQNAKFFEHLASTSFWRGLALGILVGFLLGLATFLLSRS